MKTPRMPKQLYVLISDYANPHADAPIEVFTNKRKALRKCVWGGQRVIAYEPVGRILK